MFTHFSAPARHRRVPVVGTVISVTAHAALLATLVGGDVVAVVRGVARAHAMPVEAGGSERLHWVGIGDDVGTPTHALRPGERPPVAYVVPGRGAPRAGRPGPNGPRQRTRRPDLVARKPEAPLLSLRPLPMPPEIDVAILVAGVVASAPDPARMASRAEDFKHLPVAEMVADRLAHPDIEATEMMQTLSHVDVLPVALVNNPRPSYPAMLAQSRTGGQVLVEFSVDSAGTIDVGSLRVIESTNALFTQAVRSVIPHLHFFPAQLGRHAVGVTVRQPFVFTIRSGI